MLNHLSELYFFTFEHRFVFVKEMSEKHTVFSPYYASAVSILFATEPQVIKFASENILKHGAGILLCFLIGFNRKQSVEIF